MDKKVIIFDLDGTLLNTLEDLTDSTNFALKSFNFPEKNINQIRSYVGNGVSKLIERAIPNGLSNPDFEECLSLFKKHYAENMYNKTKPYNGIIKLLKDLKIKGYKTAVISNKFDSAVKKLCEKYFKNLIDLAVGENETEGLKKKPSPDMVVKVIEIFNLPALFVGDSEVDIQTAINAKIPCISVSWGFKDNEFLFSNGAKVIIDNPDEIFKYL
ncbi:HAD-IA family hydrolase [bacterium]|nr:HAD-IA family hydrolase [bacterium]